MVSVIIIDRRFMPPKYRQEFGRIKDIISESLSETIKDSRLSIVYLDRPDISQMDGNDHKFLIRIKFIKYHYEIII